MLRFLRGGNKRNKTIWWFLIIVTVVTFVGGFVFLLGAGFDSTTSARASGAVGVVNGERVTREQFQNALVQQRQLYTQRYNTEPTERDQKVIELQAWRGIVSQRLVADKAKQLGIKSYDPEIVLALKTQPPQMLQQAPAFQTDGKFDYAKYQAALQNPGNNWAPFEAMVREELPVRKLQEWLLASVKLSEPELRQAFREQFEKLDGAYVAVSPTPEDLQAITPSDADVQRVYDQYKSRWFAGTRVQLELLMVPKTFGEEETRAARELANSLAERARAGEDFAQLARDYSEGPGAEQGGTLPRVIQPNEFGPELGEHLASLPVDAISDPHQDGGRFLIFRILERVPSPMSPLPGLRVAQIVVNIKPNDETLRTQLADLRKLRDRAESQGLGTVAAARGFATTKSGFFDWTTNPPALFSVPEAQDWGLTAKKGDVSPVFIGIDEFAIAQVSDREEAGPRSKAELADQLRQVAAVEMATDKLKPVADRIAAGIAAGQTLEQAAKAAGQPVHAVTSMTRLQPDPRIMGIPELVGAMFAARPRQVIGPVRAVNGWYFGRTDRITPADSSMYEQNKGQISNNLLQRRQQIFFEGLMARLRQDGDVKDLRSDGSY
jgi:peptidyl-prolyl cis-trans isomerase D